MPVQYQVRAQVIDIRTDTPRAADRFYVDTNVWFWTTYSSARHSSNPPRAYQTADYPTYLRRALNQDAELLWCGLSLSEQAHRIERTEHEIFCQTTGQQVTVKEYRHSFPAERQRVVREIQSAWQNVESIGHALATPVVIDESFTHGH